MSFHSDCDRVLDKIIQRSKSTQNISEQEISDSLNISMVDVKIIFDRLGKLGFIRMHPTPMNYRAAQLQPSAHVFIASGTSFAKQEAKEVAEDLNRGMDIRHMKQTNRLSWIAIGLSAIAILLQMIETLV